MLFRSLDNYIGDGQSSLLFDAYINEYGGEFYTVDISKESVDFCRSKVSEKSVVTQDDSIKFLKRLNSKFIEENKKIDFLYLDSFDAPRDNPNVLFQSSLHHLYEFMTILPSLKSGTLVVVDDCWFENGNLSGKGTMIWDYMSKIEVIPCHVGYQIGWKL